MFGLNKITIYIILAVMFFGSLTATYFSWKSAIRHQALLEFNQQQIEETAKNQQEFMKAQKEIFANQQTSIQQLLDQNNRLSDKINGINTFLSSDAAKKSDRPSSDVLKRTFQMIQEPKK
jgi:hypothetical protein